MENDFSGVKVGDKVFHVMHGWGTVVETSFNSFCVTLTDRPDRNYMINKIPFWLNGKVNLIDKNSSVFWDEIKIIPPPKPKRKVEKIIEGWMNIYPNSTTDKDIIASTCYLYVSQEAANREAYTLERIGEACHVIHKYTVEE